MMFKKRSKRVVPTPVKPVMVRCPLPLIDAVSILAGLRHQSVNAVFVSIVEEHIREGRAFGPARLEGFQFGNPILAAGMRSVQAVKS